VPTLQPRHPQFPVWLKKKLSLPGHFHSVNNCISELNLHTVCAEAKCPNRGECFSNGTATFLIMGSVCTRKCGFCGVDQGEPAGPDPLEPEKVGCAAARMGLRHIVITSVTRDDLTLGGAEHFAETVKQCRVMVPHASIEILIPDFRGNAEALDTVLAAKPDILNHNLETVPRLYPVARPQADVDRSLELLARSANRGFVTKSGIMVGLGETEDEVHALLRQLKKTGCGMVTIGQYLRPSKKQLPVIAFITPDQFHRYEQMGKELGFASTFAGPFVRSSYRAGEVFKEI
jgi:lipoyl synthase